MLGIVCTEYCSTILDNCIYNYLQYLSEIYNIVIFVTSCHSFWLLKVHRQILKIEESYHSTEKATYTVQSCIRLTKLCLNYFERVITNGKFYPRVPTCGVYSDSPSGYHTCLCNSRSLQSWTSCQAVCENASL